MIASAAVARQVRRAGEFGVRAAAPQVDLAAVADRKDRIAGSIRSGSYHAVKRAEELDFYQAQGPLPLSQHEPAGSVVLPVEAM